jgi:alpha-L-arabinofuranosidase
LAILRRKNGREETLERKFWGVGNESWGFGGIMTADYYSDCIAITPPIAAITATIVFTALPAV